MQNSQKIDELKQAKNDALKNNKGVVTSTAKLQDAQNAKSIKRRYSRKKKSSKKKKDGVNPLIIGRNASTSSQTNTLSLKIYTEQLMQADDRAKYEQLALDMKKMKNAGNYDEKQYKAKQTEYEKLDHDACVAFVERVKAIDPKQFCVVSIRHDKDTVRDKNDLFEVSIKKPHWHIYVWTPSEKEFFDAGRTFRIHTIICGDDRKGHVNPYLGITYDPKRDVSIWDNRGAERIHNIIACVAYCLHISSSAIDAGKHTYDRREIISNLSNSDIERMLNLYKGVGDSNNNFIKKPNADDWQTWGEMAYDRGLQLKSFEDWAVDHFMVAQMASAPYKVVRKFYERGLTKGLASATQLDRCNIFILGAGNLGKSYNAHQAFLDMGINNIVQATSGSGKYDAVTADTEALLFDDTRMSQARTVMEQRPVKLHRRNSNDPVWKGQWLAYTSNFEDPLDVAANCFGYQPSKNEDGELVYNEKQLENMTPVIQRGFFCRVELDADPKSPNYGHYHLVLSRRVCRGDSAQIDRLCEMFEKFRKAFDKSIRNYEPEPVLVFQAKLRKLTEIHAKQKAHEKIHVPITISGHSIKNLSSEFSVLPADMPINERAELRGQAQAWVEYANRIDAPQEDRNAVVQDPNKPINGSWGDTITRANNAKMAELEKYDSDPVYLDDPLGEDDSASCVVDIMPNDVENSLGKFHSGDVEIPDDFMENAYEY